MLNIFLSKEKIKNNPLILNRPIFWKIDPRRKASPGLAVGPEVAKAKINLSTDF